MFEKGDGLADEDVAFGESGARFDGEGSLAGCGTEFIGREALMDPLGTTEAIETSCGEDEGVALSGAELSKAGVDVAPDVDEFDVGAQREELGAAAWACGTDAASQWERVKSPVWLTDPDIACVGALGDSGERELWSELRGEIFERVDGEVDAILFERLFDFLDEDSLAVEVRRGNKACLLHVIASGADNFDLSGVALSAECFEDMVGLPERELGAAGAYADGRGHDIR